MNKKINLFLVIIVMAFLNGTILFMREGQSYSESVKATSPKIPIKHIVFVVQENHSFDNSFDFSRNPQAQLIEPANFVENTLGSIAIYKVDTNYAVKESSIVLYNNTNPYQAIQIAMNNLSNGGEIFAYNGTYSLNQTIVLGENIHFHGQGNNTVLDFSQIGTKPAIVMRDGSSLADIKITGSINPLPKEFTQAIVPLNNTRIDSIFISKMGFGINLQRANNVTILNIKCEDIRSKKDWANCIDIEHNSRNVVINGFTIKDSDRAIEIESLSKNVTAENGYLENITNYDNSGNEAFSLDVHSHDTEGACDNIIFKNVYLRNSYAPSSKAAGQLYLLSDLPRNVLYQNITLVNPTSAWQVNGINVTIKDSKIINSTNNIFELRQNSRNITIDNVETDSLHNGKWFVTNNLNYTGIENIKIVNSKINISPDKLDDQVFQLNGVDNLTHEYDTIVKNGVISDASVPEFPRLDWIIFVIALSFVPMTRFLFRQT